MKIKFRGELTLPELGLAMTKAQRLIGFDPETQVIRGCTVYFNVYDRSTGDPLAFTLDGSDLEEIHYATPLEVERDRQKALRQKTKIHRRRRGKAKCHDSASDGGFP